MSYYKKYWFSIWFPIRVTTAVSSAGRFWLSRQRESRNPFFLFNLAAVEKSNALIFINVFKIISFRWQLMFVSGEMVILQTMRADQILGPSHPRPLPPSQHHGPPAALPRDWSLDLSASCPPRDGVALVWPQWVLNGLKPPGECRPRETPERPADQRLNTTYLNAALLYQPTSTLNSPLKKEKAACFLCHWKKIKSKKKKKNYYWLLFVLLLKIKKNK